MKAYCNVLRKLAGFTLVEIMIVVLIIGVLLGIAIPNFIQSREGARAKACIGNLKQIDSANQQWMMDNKTSTITCETWPTSGPVSGSDSENLVGTYIHSAPYCPEGGTYQTFDYSATGVYGTAAAAGQAGIPMCSLGSNLKGSTYFPHSLT